MPSKQITIAEAKARVAEALFDLTDRFAALNTEEKATMLNEGVSDEILKSLTDSMKKLKNVTNAAVRAEKKVAAGSDAADAAEDAGSDAGTEDATPIVAAKAPKRPYNRKTPLTPAKSCEVGHEQVGQDGATMYRIAVMANGVKRWTIAK